MPPAPSLLPLAERLAAVYAAANADPGAAAAHDAKAAEIEALIRVTQAATAKDACVHLMLAIDDAHGIEDAAERERLQRLLWSALDALARETGMVLTHYGGAVFAPARLNPWKADIFADAVKLFSAAGEAEMALPAAPSEALLLAGAQAAGCSLDALRRGYAAMVSAYGSA